MGYSRRRGGFSPGFGGPPPGCRPARRGYGSTAQDINNHGQIVGTRTTADGDFHGFLWQNGQSTDLGLVNGPVYVNESGQVASTGIVAFESTAFRWQDATDLPPDIPVLVLRHRPGDQRQRRQVIGRAINGEIREQLIWTDKPPPGSLSWFRIIRWINNRGR